MDHAAAVQLARRWVTDRNRHDLDRILSHDDPTVTLTSPAAKRFGAPSGTVSGLPALADDFSAGLAAYENLAFESDVVFAGVRGLTVGYRNHRQQRCAATMLVGDDGRIQAAHVHDASAPR